MVAPLVFVFHIEEGSLFQFYLHSISLLILFFLPLFSFMSFLRQIPEQQAIFQMGPNQDPFKLRMLLVRFSVLKFKYFMDHVHILCTLRPRCILCTKGDTRKVQTVNPRSLPVQLLALWRSAMLRQIIFSKVYFPMHFNFEVHLHLSLPPFCLTL